MYLTGRWGDHYPAFVFNALLALIGLFISGQHYDPKVAVLTFSLLLQVQTRTCQSLWLTKLTIHKANGSAPLPLYISLFSEGLGYYRQLCIQKPAWFECRLSQPGSALPYGRLLWTMTFEDRNRKEKKFWNKETQTFDIPTMARTLQVSVYK